MAEGFLAKLLGKARGNSIPEQRKNFRYDVSSLDGVFLTDKNASSHSKVLDISYGGLSIKKQPTFPLIMEENIAVNLSFLGNSTSTKLSLVSEEDEIQRFSFLHDDPHTLIFLRNFLEQYRIGKTVAPIDSSLVKDEFTRGDWVLLRGDEGIDIKIHMNQKSIETAQLTFAMDRRIVEFNLINSKIETRSQQLDQNRVRRMLIVKDKGIEDNAVFLLAGAFSRTGIAQIHEWIAIARDKKAQ